MPHGESSVLTRDEASAAPDDADRDVDAAIDPEVEAAEALAAAAQARAESMRADAATPVRRGLRRPGWSAVVAGIAVIVTAAALAVSGYFTWHHREASRQHQQSAEFTAAARQIVYTLMSIDAAKAEDSVQQILDSSTGQFHEEFESAADDFVKLARDGEVVTDVNVKAAAVESMTNDSATVLVTATSTVTNAAGADEQPRSWRLSVDVVRDAGQLKMSKMEFVP